jgi:hypothetical protein
MSEDDDEHVFYRWDSSQGSMYFFAPTNLWEDHVVNSRFADSRELLARGTRTEMEQLWKLTREE